MDPTTTQDSPLSPPTQPPKREFTLFPHLPPELQLHIFSFALPSPRLFYFHQHPERKITYKTYDPSSIFLFPGLLQVCALSRSFALKHYQKHDRANWFEDWLAYTRTYQDSGIPAPKQFFYFDAERDMAFSYCAASPPSFCFFPIMKGVKNVCLRPSSLIAALADQEPGVRELMAKLRPGFPDVSKVYGLDHEWQVFVHGHYGTILALEAERGMLKMPLASVQDGALKGWIRDQVAFHVGGRTGLF